MPQTIRNLRPHVVLVDYDRYLIIEMHGGMEHFGVRIYPDDVNEADSGFAYGDRKLLEGLWYYDEQYNYGREEYDKQIDGLIARREEGHIFN